MNRGENGDKMADLKKASREMRYQTYLVSCWQEQDETTGKTSWRFRLEFLKTGKQHLLTTLKEVMAVIEEALDHKPGNKS
jgi:hypothetical protein